MPLAITKVVKVPGEQVRAAYWRGQPWLRLIAALAEKMGDAARVNIIKHGEPSGDWPKLSGYNKANEGKPTHAQDKRTARDESAKAAELRDRATWEDEEDRRRMLREQAFGHESRARHANRRSSQRSRGRSLRQQAKARAARAKQFATAAEYADTEEQRREAERSALSEAKQARTLRLTAGAMRHIGYARRKAMGKTPGRGKFGPDVRLRDTGNFFANMDGKQKFTSDGAIVRMVSRGMVPGRPANNDLLEIFIRQGRDPGEDMGLYEKQVARLVRVFLDNAPKV